MFCDFDVRLCFVQKPEDYIVVWLVFNYIFFFFQAEDGIRDHCVTGVQTCALPILFRLRSGRGTSSTLTSPRHLTSPSRCTRATSTRCVPSQVRISICIPDRIRISEIGRASCRERV